MAKKVIKERSKKKRLSEELRNFRLNTLKTLSFLGICISFSLCLASCGEDTLDESELYGAAKSVSNDNKAIEAIDPNNIDWDFVVSNIENGTINTKVILVMTTQSIPDDYNADRLQARFLELYKAHMLELSQTESVSIEDKIKIQKK